MFQHFVPSSSDLSVSRSLFSSDTLLDVQPSEFLYILFTILTHFIYLYIYMHKSSYVHSTETFNFISCYKRCFNWLRYRAVSPNSITGPFNFCTLTLYLKNWYCQIAYYGTVVSWFTPCISTFSYHAIPAAKLFLMVMITTLSEVIWTTYLLLLILTLYISHQKAWYTPVFYGPVYVWI